MGRVAFARRVCGAHSICFAHGCYFLRLRLRGGGNVALLLQMLRNRIAGASWGLVADSQLSSSGLSRGPISRLTEAAIVTREAEVRCPNCKAYLRCTMGPRDKPEDDTMIGAGNGDKFVLSGAVWRVMADH